MFPPCAAGFVAAGEDDAALMTRAPGYLLNVPAANTDLGAFTEHVDRARRADRARALPDAAEYYDAAGPLARTGPPTAAPRSPSSARTTSCTTGCATPAARGRRSSPLNGMGTTAPAKGKKVSIAGAADGSAQVAIIGF